MTEIEMPMEFTTHMLKTTVETLIDLDEPETILPTLRRAAERQRGERWRRLAHVLGEAEVKLDLLNNAKPAGPDFTKPAEASPVDAEHSERNQEFMAKQKPEPVNADAEPKSA